MTTRWRSRIRLVDELAEEIRSRIYSRRYPSGTPLRQEQLARELEVSRTPLREALRMLEQEKLVTVLPGNRVEVASADLPTLQAAYEVREMIDGLAARLTCRNHPDGLKEELSAWIEKQRAALNPWNPSEWTPANVAFHTHVLRASQNEYLIAQLPIIRMTSQVFVPVTLLDLSRAESALSEHLAIADALLQRDEDHAEMVARAHVRATLEDLRAKAEPAETPFGKRMALQERAGSDARSAGLDGP